jgi:small subunit ribosomal protein S1
VEDGDKMKIFELLKKLIGVEVLVRILDADRLTEKLIVSEKAAQSEKERAVIGKLRVGDTISGEVSGVVDFGAFVKFFPTTEGSEKKPSEKLEGLVHISELAWQLIDDPREIVKTGDRVEAKIIGIEDTRISLSMKALKSDPWSIVMEKYKVNDIVEGKVDKINHFGAFVYLDEDIHGLAHVSEFHDVYPNRKMEELFTIGETYSWKILSIEAKSHRMGLLPVKDAKEKAENAVKAEKKEKPSKEKKENEMGEEKSEAVVA